MDSCDFPIFPVPADVNAAAAGASSKAVAGQQEPDLRRIAVIAIHGVSDQAERDTAHAAATLLQHSPHALYSPFEASTLRLPVTPPPAGYTGSSPDLKFTADLLTETEVPPDETIYETIRLRSIRREPNGASPPREVHVFEMYWGDLSRAPGNFARMFIEFYQLAFLVSSVGRETLRLAAERESDIESLGFARQVRDMIERLLILVIPVLNIGIFWFACGLLPLAVKETWLPVGNSLLAVLGGAVFFALYRRGRGGRFWLLWLPCLLGIGGAVYYLFSKEDVRNWGWLTMSCLILAITGFALQPLWKSYGIRVRGARWFGPLVTICGALAFGWTVIGAVHDKKPYEQLSIMGVLRGAEWLLLALWLVWLTLYVMQIILSASSLRAGLRPGDPAKKRLRRRALWTGEISVFIPLMVIMLLNITFWQGVNQVIQKLVPDVKQEVCSPKPAPWDSSSQDGNTRVAAVLSATQYEPLTLLPGTRKLLDKANAPVADGVTPESMPATMFIDGRINQSCGMLPRVAFLCALGLAVTVWGLLPAILLEAVPLSPKNPDSQKAETSNWHGRTLVAGYWGMRWAGEAIRWLIVLSSILTLPLIMIPGVAVWLPTSLSAWLSPTDADFPAVSLLGAAFLGMLLSSSVFGSLAFGFRAALDVALDVVNWLRRDPHGRTARARIFARYNALLEHLKVCEHRDGRIGYDAVVILAHSQGTVITADVLRFLTAQSENRKLPAIDFFTMGCPLRQLYSLRFPHLYEWVRDDNEKGTQTRPEPDGLGVSRWWNTYRSADYVGRYLWQTEEGGDPWKTGEYLLDDGRRREWCLGAGAHTHYWDENGAEVGVALDKLVATA